MMDQQYTRRLEKIEAALEQWLPGGFLICVHSCHPLTPTYSPCIPGVKPFNIGRDSVLDHSQVLVKSQAVPPQLLGVVQKDDWLYVVVFAPSLPFMLGVGV